MQIVIEKVKDHEFIRFIIVDFHYVVFQEGVWNPVDSITSDRINHHLVFSPPRNQGLRITSSRIGACGISLCVCSSACNCLL